MVLPSGFLKMVESQLVISFEGLFGENETASAEAHRRNLQKFQSFWRRMHSDSTCFVCLSRAPQYDLPCGHSVCERCVRIFANWHHTDSCMFKICSCFLCGLEFPEILVKVKSATAGVRILLIDGGGVRGIFPLRILELLNDRVGLPYPIQENFNGAFGISSGKLTPREKCQFIDRYICTGCLSILVLFVNGWSVDVCVNTFESLAKEAFKPRGVLHVPILSYIQRLVVWYLSDSLYSADNLKAALKKTFTSDKSIFDCSYVTGIGAKLNFPVITVSETSSCIFTNYNGVGTHASDCDMCQLIFCG